MDPLELGGHQPVNDTDRWTCSICGQTYPVPTLARDCEAKHQGGQQ